MNPAAPVMRMVNSGSSTRQSSTTDSAPVTGGNAVRAGFAPTLRSSVRPCLAPNQSAVSPCEFPNLRVARVLCSYSASNLFVPGSASMSLKAMTNSSKAATMKPEHRSKSANRPYRQATGSTPASRFNSQTRQTWDASVDVACRKNGARLSAVTGEFGASDPNQPFARSRGPGAYALS